jgi:hypothetical protein
MSDNLASRVRPTLESDPQAAGINDLFIIGLHHEKAGGNRPAG